MTVKRINAVVRNLKVGREKNEYVVTIDSIEIGDDMYPGFCVRARTLDEVLLGVVAEWSRFCQNSLGWHLDLEFRNSVERDSISDKL